MEGGDNWFVGRLGSGSVVKKVVGDSDLVSLSCKDGDGVCIGLRIGGVSDSEEELGTGDINSS